MTGGVQSRAWLVLSALVACDSDPPPPAGSDAGAGAGFGERCATTEDCASGLCIRVDADGGVCTRPCAAADDCPAGESWGCVVARGFPHSICACSSTGSEICGDDLDNDCDGETDDCRICDGRAVPNDDPRHCGACGNACRFDQRCDAGTCVCAADAQAECADRCVDLTTDADHCGRCSLECHADQDCEGGNCVCPVARPAFCEPTGCVDTTAHARHCGGCDMPCDAAQVCRDSACVCPLETAPDLCPGIGCVDFASDPLHCGDCETRCPVGQVCSDGECACAPDTPLHCGATCVDPMSDAAHCGECDRPCAPPNTCADGECGCPFEGWEICDGLCRNLSRDAGYCGSCDRACAPGERCSGGACVCASGLVCGGRCVDVDEPANCGACERTCSSAQVCLGGMCTCPATGHTACGDVCADLTRDPRFCGSCSRACRPTEVCVGGACVCPTGTTFCASDGACHNLSTDRAHCGACDRACPAVTRCAGGACGCPSGTYCSSVDACITTSSDPLHCGGCDRPCRPTETCGGGGCFCAASGTRYCDSESACVATFLNPRHCNGCDIVCPADGSCAATGCVCDDPVRTACGGVCVDTRVDDRNCGACGNACTAPMACRGGTCLCPTATLNPPNVVRAPGPVLDLTGSATSGTNVALAWFEGSPVITYDRAFFNVVRPDGSSTGRAPSDLAATATPSTHTRHPAVVWTGTDYAVFWSAGVDPTSVPTGEVWYQRYTVDGTAIDAPVRAFAAAVAGNRVRIRDVQYSGTAGYYVLYDDQNPTGRSLGLSIRNISGAVISAPLALATVEIVEARSAIDPAGRVGVVWRPDTGRSRFVAVSPSLTLVAPAVDIHTATIHGVDIVWDGAEWTIAYARSPAFPDQIHLARGPSFPTSFFFSTDTRITGPLLAEQGGEIAVTWWGGSPRIARLRPEGTTYAFLDAPVTTSLFGERTVVAGPVYSGPREVTFPSATRSPTGDKGIAATLIEFADCP